MKKKTAEELNQEIKNIEDKARAEFQSAREAMMLKFEKPSKAEKDINSTA